MERKLLAVALVASLALAGCIGGSDDAGASSDDAPTDRSGDMGDETDSTSDTDPGADDGNATGNASETEDRQLVDDEFSLTGSDSSQSFDLTLPNGTESAVVQILVDNQAAAGFSYSVFDDCSGGSAQAVVLHAPGVEFSQGPLMYEQECGSPEPGDYSLTVRHDAGLSTGTANVTATVPVDA